MKLTCEHCHKNINKHIIYQFGHYKTGHFICPHCQKKNKRYLSELDILLYYSFSSILYAAALMLTVTLMNLYGTTFAIILFTLVMVTVLFFILNWIALKIYEKAWLKNAWKNYTFDENSDKIAKKGNRQFWIIMLTAFVFATQKQLIAFYPAVILAITLILFIQIMLLVSKEKDIIEIQKKRKK